MIGSKVDYYLPFPDELAKLKSCFEIVRNKSGEEDATRMILNLSKKDGEIKDILIHTHLFQFNLGSFLMLFAEDIKTQYRTDEYGLQPTADHLLEQSG